MIKKLQFLALLIGFNSFAQTVFLPSIGTKWHYLYRSLGSNPQAPINSTVEYIKDSFVSNEMVKVLKFDRVFNFCAGSIKTQIFIRQRNDSVFLNTPQSQITPGSF